MRGLRGAARVAVLLALAACGDDDGGRTAYGPADEVQAWRSALNPLIDEVTAIENEVSARAIDADSVAIDARLVEVYTEVRPRLEAVQASFRQVEPPPRLADLHAEIGRLLQLRLDAYQLVMEAFAAGQVERYPEAVALLRQANELIPDINAELLAVDEALSGLNDRVLARRVAQALPAA